jgi:ATP-dependent Clp protease adaptor protein ClpS
MTTLPQQEELSDVLIEDLDDLGRGLVVFNDEVNTFDHVIDTLIKVCRHNRIQAEQCTHIIHHKGKCEVKKGTYEVLKPMKEGIIDKGINAAIV